MTAPLQGRGRGPDKRTRMLAAAVLLSVVFYGVIIGVLTGDPAVRAKMVEAFGPRPIDLPVTVVVALIATLLYVPVPLVVWHLTLLALKAADDGRRFRLPYLFVVGQLHPEMRHSQQVALGGVAYWFLIAGCWIVIAAVRGI